MDKLLQKRLDTIQSVLIDKRMETERRKPYYVVWTESLMVDKWAVSLHHRASPEQDTTEEMTSADLLKWFDSVKGKRIYLDMFKCIEWFYCFMMVTLPKLRGRPPEDYTHLLEAIEKDSPHLQGIRAEPDAYQPLIAVMTRLEQMERIT